MSSLSLAFKVSNVPFSREFSTRQNIKKPYLFPKYQGFVDEVDAVCGFVGSKEITPTSSLTILHLEDTLEANAPAVLSTQKEWVGTSTSFPTNQVLITDVVGDYIGRTPTPLFWKCVLPSTTVNVSSVAILNKDLAEVPVASYRVLAIQAHDDGDLPIADTYEEIAVYSNYQNKYDEKRGEYEAYYIKFTAAGAISYILLNQVPALSLASVDDISIITGALKPWRRVYYTTATLGGYSVTVSNPLSHYFMKPTVSGRIALSNPTALTDTDPWFLKVSNGSFMNVIGVHSYRYSVPEYGLQSFTPLQPYKLAVGEKAIRITSQLYLVSSTPLQIDTSFYSMDILVKDREDNVLYAFTTKASKDGTNYLENGRGVYRTIETDSAWVTWDSGGVRSWDVESGFIQLRDEFRDKYSIHVTYYYEEEAYELTSLNTNPIFDEDFAGQSYIVYAVPIGGDNIGTAARSNGIFYLQIDRSGLITSTSQGAGTGNIDFKNTLDTYQYIWYSKLADGVTSADIFSADTEIPIDDVTGWPDQGTVLIESPTGITWGTAYKKTYVSRDLTTNSLILDGGDTVGADIGLGAQVTLASFKETFSVANLENQLQWFPLGQVTPFPSQRVDELSVLDLRVNGGIIKDKFYEEALKFDPRVAWVGKNILTGFGQVFPGNTAVVFKVPFTLLKDYGGQFQPDEIETIIHNRHLAIGAIPVILYSGPIPKILDISYTKTTADFLWTSEGDAYLYNIYQSFSKDGPWELVNSEPIPDYLDVYSGSGGGSVIGSGTSGSYGVEYNTHTVTGLIAGTVYYFAITSISPDGVESPKGQVWGIQTVRS